MEIHKMMQNIIQIHFTVNVIDTKVERVHVMQSLNIIYFMYNTVQYHMQGFLQQ